MRILTITSAYPSHADDPRGIFIHRLVASLAAQGLTITVVAPGADQAPLSETRDGVAVQRVNYWLPGWQALAVGVGGIVPNLRRNPLLLPQVPALVWALTKRAVRIGAEFDLVHAHWTFPAGVAGRAAARAHGIPLIVTSHGGDLNLSRRVGLLRPIARMVCRSADACIGVSQAMVDEFVSLGVLPRRVRFIPYGVPPLLAPSSRELPERVRSFAGHPGLRIVYVGSLIPRKSVETLLEAHAILERRGHQHATLIVGDGPEKGALHAIVESQRLRNVTFCGSQPPAIAAACMRAGDVLVLPSRSEGRPLVLLEAMSLGLPVVASNIPGSRELARPGVTGMLFPAGDAAALADNLEHLMNTPVLRTTLGAGGLEFVRVEHLTAEGIARRHIELYQDVLQGG